MRESRLSGSEGGGCEAPYPYQWWPASFIGRDERAVRWGSFASLRMTAWCG